jgi:hypothetical protein
MVGAAVGEVVMAERRDEYVQDRAPLSDAARRLFETGDVDPKLDGAFEVFGQKDQRALWAAHESEFMAGWIAHHPGTRPAAWWAYSAPEPLRRRLGGTGTERAAVLGMAPDVRFGIDVGFLDDEDIEWYSGRAKDVHGKVLFPEWQADPLTADAYDPQDPPRFESQASFLARHGLLTADERERLPKTAFAPDVITDVEEVVP